MGRTFDYDLHNCCWYTETRDAWCALDLEYEWKYFYRRAQEEGIV